MIEPIYSDRESDPRLINVNLERKRLRNIVSDGEWNGEDVTAENCQLKILSAALLDGRLYLPKF